MADQWEAFRINSDVGFIPNEMKQLTNYNTSLKVLTKIVSVVTVFDGLY